MKIVSKGRVLNSSEFYKRKQRRKRIKLVLFLISFVLLISLLIYFSRHERIQINEVVVLGEEVVGKEEVVSTAKQLLAGYYFWIIPKTNIFLYPRSDIKNNILRKFPRFKSIDLDVNGFHSLSINVLERVPFALYCRDTSECYFLDEDGFIFALAASFSEAVYFIYTTEDSIENPVGEKIVSVDEFGKLSEFIKTLTVLNIYPEGLKTSENEYRLLLSTGGEIIWRRDANLTHVYSNLEAFLADEFIRAQSNFLDKISHLDLRTENKVFYKFK
jgi:hypothetical protein